jgi:predicted transcriptional regulator
MIYRDRIDIISQILEAANGGITKTRIMYKAFLSYAQMKEHLTLLTEKGLLRYDENIRIFRTTEKGRQFLDIYSRISNMINEGQQQQQQMWI